MAVMAMVLVLVAVAAMATDAEPTTSLGANPAVKYSKRADCTWYASPAPTASPVPRSAPPAARTLLAAVAPVSAPSAAKMAPPPPATLFRPPPPVLPRAPPSIATPPTRSPPTPPTGTTPNAPPMQAPGPVLTLTSGGGSSIRLSFGTSPLIFMAALLFIWVNPLIAFVT